MPEFLVFAIGLLAAIRGSDWIGQAAVSWSRRFNIPLIVVGATIVSLATTLPELSVAAISGIIEKDPQVGLGTVLGSPLINLGLVLGFFFLFSKSRPTLGYYSRAINIFVIVALVLLVFSFFQQFNSLSAVLFILLGIIFLLLEITLGKRSVNIFVVGKERLTHLFNFIRFKSEQLIILKFILGSLLLALGSSYLVDSIISIANIWQINEFVVSFIIASIGTSLPEIITAINSVLKKREDLAVGNLVGASVLDVTLGVGLATLITPISLAYPSNLSIFLPMVAIGLFCLAALWERIPLTILGTLMILTSLTSLFLIFFWEII